MLSLMSELTDDLDWAQSIEDGAFLKAWKDRSLSHERISEQMVDWVCNG